MMRVVIYVLLAASAYALTDDEIAQFYNKGTKEKNSGLTGFILVNTDGDKHTIYSNGIPDHDTGNFPGINPNTVGEQDYEFNIPVNPTEAATGGCLPGGPIAMTVNGVPLFSPFASSGLNAVEGDDAETFDVCDGHPDPNDRYHYHKMPASCVAPYQLGVPSDIVGVALDGYAIYGPIDENGDLLTSDDLDECHGRYVNGVYRYHMTEDYPYIMGCFKGETRSDSGLGNTSRECYIANDENNSNDPNYGGGDGGGDDGGNKPPPHHGHPPPHRG
ncbi:uncharacterized protein [Ptychodera flava]|uniref:uncharacterized protein n=1 Tax=Ptychodera flava TaxID=63121 RepID=UPI003969EEEE